MNMWYSKTWSLYSDWKEIKRLSTDWMRSTPITKIISSVCVYAQPLSYVQLFVTPRTVAHQVSLFMELYRQECWNELPFPTLGDLPNPGIENASKSVLLKVYWFKCQSHLKTTFTATSRPMLDQIRAYHNPKLTHKINHHWVATGSFLIVREQVYISIVVVVTRFYT